VLLGVGHGFVSSGLFTCVGGVLYDRSGTRSISLYKGLTQLMPLFVILFFILCLGNCGAPLTLNFVGEFLSLFGVFERLPYVGLFAGISIVLSAVYTIYLLNRTAFGGVFSKFFTENIRDISHRETIILFLLVLFTVILGIYPSIITDGLNYTLSTLIFEVSEISVCTMPILLKKSPAQYPKGTCRTAPERLLQPGRAAARKSFVCAN
jgi:NADH-ubiquinone oxidoreductase chain 4